MTRNSIRSDPKRGRRWIAVWVLACVAATGVAFANGDPGESEEDPAPPPAGVDGVTQPIRLPDSFAAPVYPKKARKDRVEGAVVLKVTVSKDGSVTNLKVLRSTEPGYGFEDAAIEAVKQWRYTPATRDGEPVEVYVAVNLDFSLD